MKPLLAALLLSALPAFAGLKWEQTTQVVVWKPGQKEATVEFGYRNASKTPQKITLVKGGCACCTNASADKKNLQPGDTGRVRMRVDFRGKTLPLAKAVMVTTDDGQAVSLVLRIDTPGGKPVAVPRWYVRR